LAARVNGDTDRGRELAGDTSFLCDCQSLRFLLLTFPYLQLGKSETTSGTNSAVVFESWASDDGSQFIDGSGGNSCGLRKTSIATSQLAAGLFGVRFGFPR
jgi:hypothetical protein